MAREIADKRVPLTAETQQDLKDFKDGLGTDYDRAIQILFLVAFGDVRDKHALGRTLKQKYVDGKL